MKKNILLISFDDAVAPWIYKTAFGEPLQTPNLDKLCQRSTAFRAAYAQAPICGPSRASMMTNHMPPATGMLSNATFSFDKIRPEMIWSHALKQNGYHCSSGGKIHHGYRPVPPRLHEALYHDRRKRFRDDMRLHAEMKEGAQRFGGFKKGLGIKDFVHDSGFYDARVSESATDFLKTYDAPEPFYREVGFFSPHNPWITPARFKEMYDEKNFKKPGDWQGYLEDNSYVTKNIEERKDLQSTEWWQKTARNYFSAYSHGDHHLGRVLDALWLSRHAENTVIILVADHGLHLGNRNIIRKTTLWEQSLHVPLVIFNPDDQTGRTVEDPVALIDVGPTALDFADMDPTHCQNGHSLRAATLGASPSQKIIPSFYKNNMTVRDGRYRIIRYEDGSCQLFDVQEDYWQLRDLGNQHPAFAGMYEKLLDCATQHGFNLHTADMASVRTADDDQSNG